MEVVLINLTMNTGSHHHNTSRNLLMTLNCLNLLMKMSFYKLQSIYTSQSPALSSIYLCMKNLQVATYL